MLRRLAPALLAPALLVLLALAPLAAAEAQPEAGQPPCDGQPLLRGQEEEDQVRTLAIACVFAPEALAAACADTDSAFGYASYWSAFFLAYAGQGSPVPASPC